jgi:polar amino acid transport system substrate-binding protein
METLFLLNKKTFLAVAVTIMTSLVLASAQQVVKVGYAPFASPLTSLPGATVDNYKTLDPNGTMARGAMIDLMNAIAKDVGFRVQFVAMPATVQFAALASNKIDLSMPKAIASAQGIDFTDPLYTDSEALIVKKSDNRQYTSWEDLKGETIVTFKGTPLADLFQKSGLFKEVRLVTAGAEVVQAVRDPKVKAGFKGSLIDTTDDQVHGRYEPDVKLVTSYRPRFSHTAGIGARKGDPLLSKVNTSLRRMKAQGDVRAIFAKYGIDSFLVR